MTVMTIIVAFSTFTPENALRLSPTFLEDDADEETKPSDVLIVDERMDDTADIDDSTRRA